MDGFIIKARVTLHEDVSSRISGWRGLCSFDGIATTDGAQLFGCELRTKDGGQLTVGEEALVSLRFWAPAADAKGLTTGLGLRLFEGPNEVASGILVGVE